MENIDFRAFVDLNPDWIWALDVNGVLRYSNPAVFNMLG